MARKLLIIVFLALVCLFAEGMAGTYKGSWSGAASGDFKITLTPDGADWKAEVSFTMGNEEYKTTMKSVKVDGGKVSLVYEYDLQGNQLQSAVTGELKGRTFEGTYRASTVADGAVVDEGTWKATAEQ